MNSLFDSISYCDDILHKFNGIKQVLVYIYSKNEYRGYIGMRNITAILNGSYIDIANVIGSTIKFVEDIKIDKTMPIFGIDADQRRERWNDVIVTMERKTLLTAPNIDPRIILENQGHYPISGDYLSAMLRQGERQNNAGLAFCIRPLNHPKIISNAHVFGLTAFYYNNGMEKIVNLRIVDALGIGLYIYHECDFELNMKYLKLKRKAKMEEENKSFVMDFSNYEADPFYNIPIIGKSDNLNEGMIVINRINGLYENLESYINRGLPIPSEYKHKLFNLVADMDNYIYEQFIYGKNNYKSIWEIITKFCDYDYKRVVERMPLSELFYPRMLPIREGEPEEIHNYDPLIPVGLGSGIEGR